MIGDVVILFLVVVLLVSIFENFTKWNSPPGPIKFPLVGTLPQVLLANSQVHLALHALSRTHGAVMQLKFGLCDAVVISSFDAAKAICSMENVNGRILTPIMASRVFGKENGLILSGGEFWKTTRRFVVKNLREFGFGKSGCMETVIHEQADELIDRISVAVEQNKAVDMLKLFCIPVLNVLWGMVAGETYPQDSDKLTFLMEIQDKIMRSGNFATGIAISFPFLAKWFPTATGVTANHENHLVLRKFLENIMDVHQEKLKQGNEPTCFVDKLLLEIEKHQAIENSQFTRVHGAVILIDLFNAGSETSSAILAFCLLYTTKFPDVQQKIQQEIDTVIGKEQPSLNNIPKFPYTHAVIFEVMRHAVIVPLTPPRTSATDIAYNGIVIKKNTPIMVNLYSILYDNATWGDPSVFRPERFLNASGELDTRTVEKLASFGFGHRHCIGDRLSEAIISLFFVKLLQNFTYETPAGDVTPCLDPKVGFSFTPRPFRLVFKNRF